MRPLRVLALLVLTAVELAVLAAIVLVLRNSTGTPVWNWGSGWGDGAEQVTEERFIPLPNLKGTLVVHNDMGKVEVTTGTSGFGVHADVYAFGKSKDDALDAAKLIKFNQTTNSNSVTVAAKGPQNWVGRRPYANLEVIVPAGVKVEVDASMGSVEVRNLTGAIDVKAGMGRVEVLRASGDVTVDARMGKVELTDVTVKDLLDVKAGMGSITFTGKMGKQNTLDASMGSITVDLAANQPAMRLNADWGLGRFSNSLPLAGKVDDNKAEGLLGKGKEVGELSIKAGMGSIEIR